MFEHDVMCLSEKRLVRCLKKSDESDLIPMDFNDLTVNGEWTTKQWPKWGWNKKWLQLFVTMESILRKWFDLVWIKHTVKLLGWNKRNVYMRMMGIQASEILETREETHFKFIKLVWIKDTFQHECKHELLWECKYASSILDKLVKAPELSTLNVLL